MGEPPDNLIPLETPPGLVLTVSPNAAKGRYIGGNHCRFVNGFPEKWKGWRKKIATQLVGVARGMVSWTNRYGNVNVAIGTHIKLYALLGDDELQDITPVRASSTINNNPFATTSASATVTVTDTAHGAGVGDRVVFSGATAVAGITIVGEYTILTVPTSGSYTILHTSPANATTTGGGAAVVAAYQISVGSEGTVYGLGWGAGTWGSGTWSTPRTEGLALEGRYWHVKEYGNDLLASPSLGTLYLWQEASDVRAEVVAGAPASMRAMFVTGERFIFALGTTTGMTVQWPDVDDITDWTPSAANTANTRTLQSGGKLMGGCPLGDGINLVWSDTSLYVFQKVETEFIYNDRLAGTNCGLIGPGAFDVASGVAYWLSGQNAHMYVQGVKAIPRFEEISKYIFKDMDPGQVAKIWCLYDQMNDQVRWGYCSHDSFEPDKYFDVNLTDYSWTHGTLDRTTGCRHRPAQATSLMVSSDSYIYNHDDGLDDDTVALEFELNYGEFQLTRGEVNVDIAWLIPDTLRQAGAIDYEVYTKERPNSTDHVDDKTVTLNPGDALGECRVSGRVFGMTVRQSLLAGDVALGIVNLGLGPSGERP